jgi:hypothetical protein
LPNKKKHVSLQRENMRTKDMDKTTETVPVRTLLIDDLRSIINRARANVALKANAELILMFWEIGERINREVLGNKRATYGQQIVSQVATQLSQAAPPDSH